MILSVLCAVAGLILLSWSAMHNLAVSAVAGLATLVLGVLIENISINALKNIRQASEAIRASEEEFYHRQGESIKEAMRTNEMQTELFKQQAEDIVMETTIEALEGVRNDPAAMSDVQHTVKKEIKATIKHLTARAASRLVRVEEVQQRTPHRLSAPRTDHVQTTDSRGDRSVWIEQDTTGQQGVDSLDHPFTDRTGQQIRGSDRTRQRTGQGRTEGRGRGNDRADKTGQDNVSRIQAYLTGHPRARQTEIAAALDISTKTVQRALAKLKGTGGTDRQENLRIVR